LEAKGPQEYIFEEVRDVGQINFNFASKQDAIDDCSGLAREMQQKDQEAMELLIR
jgi:secreted Zn-dependent insulinase-like peptidase